MNEPICPKCGKSMVLRTARFGRNAGHQFWGCSQYPRCKATIDFGDGQGKDSPGISPNTKGSLTPQNFFVRSVIRGYQSKFIESVAVFPQLREMLNENAISEDYLRSFCQWRVDFPQNSNPQPFSDLERQILAVTEKILMRGKMATCSPRVEKKLQEIFGSSSIEEAEFANYVMVTSTCACKQPWLDSSAEAIFYERILPEVLGNDFSRWVTPQVELSSLVPEVTKEIQGRIDFLVCYPSKMPAVIEIDGAPHQTHQSADNQLKDILEQYGYRTINIPAGDVVDRADKVIAELKSIFNIESIPPCGDQSSIKALYAVKRCHQMQLVILQAVCSGYLILSEMDSWVISASGDNIFSEHEQNLILETAKGDIRELWSHLFTLYRYQPKVSGQKSSRVHIALNGIIGSGSSFVVQDILAPFHIANAAFSSPPAVLAKPDKTVLEYFLNYMFRKSSFWEGQFDAISRTLEKKDSIVLLPTGGGKSIAFQLASMLLPGRTIVVDPIISLLDDQIDNLERTGIDRSISITSQINDPEDKAKVLNLFGQGEYLFAYIAPERFQTVEFRKSLRALTVHTPIAVIAIDEAHCISEWGHDFRTAYLNIGRISRQYCVSEGHIPPLLALTGTASRSVLKDIQRELQIDDFDAIITPRSFDRPELKFRVFSSPSKEKTARLIGLMGQKLPNDFLMQPASLYQPNGKSTYSGLVFCPHVNGEFGIVEQDKQIKQALGINTAVYSGKEPKYQGGDWNNRKKAIAHSFKHNKIPVLVCTKAFGMGIDKPNIRFTVHYGIPNSIESFYQEAGRAGRDRKTAYCYILVSNDYPERSRKLLDPNTLSEEIASVINARKWEEDDDITRALFFQVAAFPGISEEINNVRAVLSILPDLSKMQNVSLTFGKMERTITEKCLHRLVVLGVVADYTVDYGKKEFSVSISGLDKERIIEVYGKYISGYLAGRREIEVEKARKLLVLPHNEFIVEMCSLLLHFIYDVIEKGRRRALSEMLAAATISPSDEGIRGRILRYLEATVYSELLEQVIGYGNGGIEKVIDIVDEIRSPSDAAELRGQVARYLESYPDHPCLLMLRAMSELLTRDRNAETVKQNFIASVSSAIKNYGVPEEVLLKCVVWSINFVAEHDVDIAESLQKLILQTFPGRELARALVAKLNPNAKRSIEWFLLNSIVDKLLNTIRKRG